MFCLVSLWFEMLFEVFGLSSGRLCTSVSRVTLLVCNTGEPQLYCPGVKKVYPRVDKWSHWIFILGRQKHTKVEQRHVGQESVQGAEVYSGCAWNLLISTLNRLSRMFGFSFLLPCGRLVFAPFSSFSNPVPSPPFWICKSLFASLYATLLFVFTLFCFF